MLIRQRSLNGWNDETALSSSWRARGSVHAHAQRAGHSSARARYSAKHVGVCQLTPPQKPGVGRMKANTLAPARARAATPLKGHNSA
jgi:hypothetical protein